MSSHPSASTGSPPPAYERFCVLHRLLHGVVMIGFTGLALTGLALAFSAFGPARAFMWLLGGSAHAAWLHRFFAIATYLCVIAHGIWFLYFKFILRAELTGPNSIVPGLKDLRDFSHHLRYFLGREKAPPQFDKYTYMEKIEYWALFIGMNTMGITGLMLWFPECFTTVLPGFFINIARILHLFEAILAIAVKFIIHIGMAHLRPAVYPADTSIFNGRISAGHLKHEHGAQWQQMQAKPSDDND